MDFTTPLGRRRNNLPHDGKEQHGGMGHMQQDSKAEVRKLEAAPAISPNLVPCECAREGLSFTQRKEGGGTSCQTDSDPGIVERKKSCGGKLGRDGLLSPNWATQPCSGLQNGGFASVLSPQPNLPHRVVVGAREENQLAAGKAG